VVAEWPGFDQTYTTPRSMARLSHQGAHMYTDFNEEQAGFFVAISAGLVVALSMLHSHVSTVPSHGHKNAMQGNDVILVTFLTLEMVKSMAVLMVGVGIKITLYHPVTESFFSLEQRGQLALALLATFGSAFGLQALHHGPLAFYGPVLRCVSPTLTLATLVRFAATATMFAVYPLEMAPWHFLLLEGCLCLLHAAALYIEAYARHHWCDGGSGHAAVTHAKPANTAASTTSASKADESNAAGQRA